MITWKSFLKALFFGRIKLLKSCTIFTSSCKQNKIYLQTKVIKVEHGRCSMNTLGTLWTFPTMGWPLDGLINSFLRLCWWSLLLWYMDISCYFFNNKSWYFTLVVHYSHYIIPTAIHWTVSTFGIHNLANLQIAYSLAMSTMIKQKKIFRCDLQ